MLDAKSATAVERAVDEATPLMHRAGEQAGALAHRSADALRASTAHLRQTARRASDGTVAYIRKEPLKAMLIAVAAGAAVAALISLITRTSSNRH